MARAFAAAEASTRQSLRRVSGVGGSSCWAPRRLRSAPAVDFGIGQHVRLRQKLAAGAVAAVSSHLGADAGLRAWPRGRRSIVNFIEQCQLACGQQWSKCRV